MRHRTVLRPLAALLLASDFVCVAGPNGLFIAYVQVSVAHSSLRVGETTTVVAEAFGRDGEVALRRREAMRLSVRDPAVASVVGTGTGMGTLTARSPGATWIVGESGGKRDSVRVTVTR